jgi:hypothetical protein
MKMKNELEQKIIGLKDELETSIKHLKIELPKAKKETTKSYFHGQLFVLEYLSKDLEELLK